MATWEHFAISWSFLGPAVDRWPGIDTVLAADDMLAEVKRALPAYLEWQDERENRYLEEMGKAGFELVTLHREVLRNLAVDQTFVRAYFKRQGGTGGSKTKPNPIGFRPPGST